MAQGQATKVKKKKKSGFEAGAAQSLQRAEVNRANRTRVRTMMRRLRTAITAGDATAAGNLLQPTSRLSIRPLPRACCTRTPPTATSRASPCLQRRQGKGRQGVGDSRSSILPVSVGAGLGPPVLFPLARPDACTNPGLPSFTIPTHASTSEEVTKMN